MSPLMSAALTASLAVLIYMTLFWLVSLWRRDASVVDIGWGPAFVLVAWIYRAHGPEMDIHHLVLLVLVTVWGLRLGIYLFVRNWGKGEDRRYAKMRAREPNVFWWRSLPMIFYLQGVLVLVISAPHWVAQLEPGRPGWGYWEVIGVALWLIGFAFEAGGDWQLARFKANPDNRGKVMDTGFWRYTRHPNYFGDCLQWWAFYIIALDTPHGWMTLPAPILMTFFLLKVSGVSLLEKDIGERRPAYRDYIERTPAFVPWFPKSKH
ncbi:MAG: DUF1295 domain-containing protein [Acidobacteriota bacterium]